MRKRPILLAGAALAAGLAAFGTVAAQPPPATPQPRVTPAGGALPPAPPAPPVRPASEWTPTPPPPGYLPGGASPQGNRPKLTSPVAATADGVRPANFTLPQPSMDPPKPQPAGAIPPPSVSQDPAGGEPKVPPLPAPATEPNLQPPPLPLPTGTPGAIDPRPPLVPAPIGPVGPSTPIPLPPPAGNGGNVGGPSLPTASAVGGDNPSSPGVGATRPAPTMAAAPSQPSKLTQTVTLEAVCPESVVLGSEFRYELIVRNAGNAAVGGVRVEDELPAGARYVGSDPPAEQNGERLAWSVGVLDAGAEKRIVVRVQPGEEGELRSRATVVCSASVEARARVTRPRVAVSLTGPEVCKAGEEPVFQITVTNSGTGPAEKMVLQAKLTEGLVHPAGAVIEAALANLPPGETKTLPLKLTAGKSGMQVCQITVAAQGSADATTKASVNVVEPLLQVAQSGPAKCIVRAEPVYEITLSNPGTAATDAITLYAVLPDGFEYLQATDGASYSASNRAVVWKLPPLAAGGTKACTLKLRAAAAGDGLLRVVARAGPEQPTTVGAGGAVAPRPAGRVLEAKAETAVKAEGVAAVRFEVRDLDDPVEAGKEALYEIRVTNQGTGVCTNVQLVAALAEGTAYTGSSGPTQVKAQGQTLVFDPIPSLPVKGEMVYQVKVRGGVPGDLRFRVQLTCDQVRTPVVKEESTRFYKE